MRGKVRGLFPVGRQVLGIAAVDGQGSGSGPGRRSGGSCRIHCCAPPAFVPHATATPFPRKAGGTTPTTPRTPPPLPADTERARERRRGGMDAPKGRSRVELPRKSRAHPMPRAPPTPLPPRRRFHTREPATPRMPKDIPNPRRPRYHPEPKCRAAPTAWQGCAGRHSREASGGAAGLNCPENPEPTPCRGPQPAPLPWAPPTPLQHRRRFHARGPTPCRGL